MTQTDPKEALFPALASTDRIRKYTYPTIRSIVTLFFILILNSLLVAIPLVIVLISQQSVSPLFKSILSLVGYVVPLLLTINYAVRKIKTQQGYPVKVNFSKFQPWIIPVVIVGTLALVVPLSQIASILPMPASVQKFFERAFTKDIFSIATVVIAAPILEEILCRGIILKGLLQNYSPQKAIIISAIFFAAIHLNPWQALPAFFGGLFLGWVYYKTQSVFPGMIVHATINAAATSFLFLPTTKKDLPELLGMPFYLLALFTSIAVFTLACFIINKKLRLTATHNL
ncbi:CPBP family intramembrane glutamic endopeptidase [Mucilaginibacter flavidus]|uniref:CPBP family intramembrane glutamic endopeptidase n=1 Tax=Mucilaginibacter flavidus TaxID=2949309 RepID=UPI002092CB4F|nr:type II CAAX endopeptidase family protein [Mucilaginibacter flavidus]MCO5946361.1 CPBP family intramembrane metalloprotease [Mucilaginibacter flavidus]